MAKKLYIPPAKKGVPSYRQTRTVIGIINHAGAFDDQVTVAIGTLHEIPSNLDPLIATLRIHQKRAFELFPQFR